jgi:hypothetical protein
MTTLLQELKLAHKEQIKVSLFIEGTAYPYDDVIIKSINRSTITFVAPYVDNKDKTTKLEQTTVKKELVNGVSYVIATVDNDDKLDDEDGWIVLFEDM